MTKIGAVKQIIMRKYVIRLRKHPANPEVYSLMKIKEENFIRIICSAREIKKPLLAAEE